MPNYWVEPLGLHLHGTAVAPFTPSSLTGLVLWVQADSLVDDGLASGSSVSIWGDDSSVGNNMLQATVANQPLLRTNVVNGHSTVSFDGVNDQMVSTATDMNSTEWTMIAVMSYWSATDADLHVLLWDDLGGADIGIRKLSNTFTGQTFDTASRTVSGSSVVVGDFTYLVETTKDDNVMQFYENGSSKGTVAIGTQFSALTAFRSASGFVEVAEYAVYNRRVNAAELQSLDSYYLGKYSL